MQNKRLETLFGKISDFSIIFQNYQPVVAYNRERYETIKRNMRRPREQKQSSYQGK